MIQSQSPDGTGLRTTDGLSPSALWIDLSTPGAAERAEVEQLMGRPLPSLEDQEEIEHSSRLYHAQGASVLTALLPVDSGAGRAMTVPVTFILTQDRLVTIRHHPHTAFDTFRTYPDRASLGVGTPSRILVGLLEALVDRLADITEQTGRDIEDLTRNAFHTGSHKKAGDHTEALRDIGRRDTEVMILRESLLSLERLLGFLQTVLSDPKMGAQRRALKSCQRDVRTIGEQANFLGPEDVASAGCDAWDDRDRAERHRQDLLDRGDGVPAADADRVVLGHELCAHAPAGVAGRVLGDGPADAVFGRVSALVVQAEGLVMTTGPVRS